MSFVHSRLLKRKGVVSRALIHVSDWYPTLLSLAGALKSHRGLDSHDVWGTINEGLPCPCTEILFNIDPVSRKPGEPYDKGLLLNGFGIWDTAVRAVIRAGDGKLLTEMWPMGLDTTTCSSRPTRTVAETRETSQCAGEVSLAF